MDENEVYGDMEDIEEQDYDEIVVGEEESLVIIGKDYSKIIENAAINEMKRLKNRMDELKDCRTLCAVLAAHAYRKCNNKVQAVTDARDSLRMLEEIEENVPFQFNKRYVKLRCEVSENPIIKVNTEETSRIIVYREIQDKERGEFIYDSETFAKEHFINLTDDEFDKEGTAYLISILGEAQTPIIIKGIVSTPTIVNVKADEIFNITSTYAKVFCETEGIPKIILESEIPSHVVVILEDSEERNCLYDSITTLTKHHQVLEDERLYKGKHKFLVRIIIDTIDAVKIGGLIMVPQIVKIEEGKEFNFINDYVELIYEVRGGFRVALSTEIPTYMVILQNQSCVYKMRVRSKEHSIELKDPVFSGKNSYSIRIYSDINDSFSGKGIVESNIDEIVYAGGGIWTRDTVCAVPYIKEAYEEDLVGILLVDNEIFVPAEAISLLCDKFIEAIKEVENNKYEGTIIDGIGIIGSIILTLLPGIKAAGAVLSKIPNGLTIALGIILTIMPITLEYVLTFSDENYLEILEKCLKEIKEKAEYYSGYGYKYGVKISCGLRGELIPTSEAEAPDIVILRPEVKVSKWDSDMLIGPKGYYGKWELKEPISRQDNYFENSIEEQLKKIK